MALAADIRNEISAEPRSGLDSLAGLVAEDLQFVNRLILRHMESPVTLIPQLAGHIIAAGGKRLRPMLTLATARLFDYQGERHRGLSAAVEFIHTATLLHDDVVDASDLRRGRSTANAVWGNQASVLVGDFLFSRAFQLMVADGSLKALKVLSDASAVIAEGEVQQLLTTSDISTDQAAYLEVIESKTASLFAAACRVGAIVADRSEAEELSVEAYGRNFGIAFQLVDDILDYSAEQAALGKTVGDDFREGKMTLPVVLTIERCNEEERAFFRRCLEDLNQQDDDLSRAIALMEKYGALDEAKARARFYGKAALQALEGFEAKPAKAALLEVVDFCIERAH